MKLQTWFYAIQSDGNGGKEIVAAKMMTEDKVMVARLESDSHRTITVEEAKSKLESVRDGSGEVVWLAGLVRANMERKIARFYR